jgi:eukaryotic-like serine/threonine-protein kinase
MSLASGVRLGPYEILSVLGVGGMGEVYRSKDTRLDRTVAVKILPSHLSGSPPLRARFDREAKAISSLSHPHICPLYDVGHQDGIDYLVMEYLEGETLASRLKKGPLPIGRALEYAVEIADALNTAHRHGLIHRDLKPENIMLTKAGTKLLDFGLAKTRANALADMGSMFTQDTSLTGEGTMLGTPQYMAPEQLEGREADARTDIFALGAVIYEMVTGRKAFEGKSQASVISAIMSSEPPDLSTVQATVPPALDHVVKTCLPKDPDERWQSAHDVLVELKWIVSGASDLGPTAPYLKPKHARNRLAGLALVTFLLAGAFVLLRYLSHKETAERAVRFSISLPEDTKFTSTETAGPTPQIAVSPDGRVITFVASHGTGPPSLWVRDLDSFTSQMLSGTEGASFPFWSPDSRFIGFFAGGKLKKLDLSARTVQVIADAPDGRGGTWNREGVIVFAEGIGSGLSQVPAAGGMPVAATVLDPSRGELSHRFPQFLPDGRHFLFIDHAAQTQLGLYTGSLGSKETRRVLAGKWSTACSVGPYLLSVREGILIARPFNVTGLKVSDEQISVAERVASSSPSGFASFSASSTGVLIYASGTTPNRQLAWFSGGRAASIGEVGEYVSPALSPDGRKIAIARIDSQTRTPDIWIFDLSRGTETRFTFDPGSDRAPLWSPDGNEIIFSSDRTGVWNLYRKSVNGASAEQLIAASPDDEFPSQWSADSRFIVYSTPRPNTNWDLEVLPLREPSKPIPFLVTRFNELQGVLSPNGQWMAYTSDETGRFEVYLQSFPAGGNKLQLSVDGGSDAKWRSDGRELFYISLKHKLMSVNLSASSRIQADAPKELFEVSVPDLVPAFPNNYAVTADGRRFLVNTVLRDAVSSPISVVLNWRTDLSR